MDKQKVIQYADQNTSQIQYLIQQKVKFWTSEVLFSSYWWFALSLSVIPWLIWWIFRNKRSTDRLFYAGLFVMCISLILDVLGDQLGFWYYRFNLIPVLPTYFPWDCTLMPVTIMFMLQIKPRTNPFIKAIIFAIVSSYIGEPIFKWMEVYVQSNWKYSYSVPIQIIIYLIAHYLSKRNKFDELV
ncbi:CBO0543 family protein [Paenibacillus aestuarii]|uniref:CBO0543 family protein n=1 Tax=Paenibacillus aestuarii TaxID=516965 RepID=A0ABW0K9Y0_9BACL|nr:CBO0543 family protein [Paenibacillus aestuarii]